MSRRGFTLLEVMVASVILALGVLATFAMLDRVEGANRSLDLTRTANEAFARLAAQIRDAQCDYDGSQLPGVLDPATTDPGLANAVGVGWVGVDVPIPGPSSITHAGLTDGSDPRLPQTVPPLRIEYRIDTEAAPVMVGGGRAPPPDPGPAFDIEIRIRQLTGDPDRDDPTLEEGWWIKSYPLKKLCNARYDRTRRGEFR